MQSQQEEQDVIETYILDDPSISKFHSLNIKRNELLLRHIYRK